MGAIKMIVSREVLADVLLLNTSEVGRVEIIKVIDHPEHGTIELVLFNETFPVCEFGEEPKLASPIIRHEIDYIIDWNIHLPEAGADVTLATDCTQRA